MTIRMRAELKSLHSPDADLRTFHPEKPECFSLLIQAMIGPAGGAAADSFEFVLCTPAWLLHQCLAEQRPVFGAHHMIVDRYDYGSLESSISSLCRSVEGCDWNEVASKLSLYASWEFSDYVPLQK